MATQQQVTEINDAGHLVDWSPYRGSAVCPDCGSHELDVRQVFRVRPPGDWSLAGCQQKYPASVGWEFRCTACGTGGGAEPK